MYTSKGAKELYTRLDHLDHPSLDTEGLIMLLARWASLPRFDGGFQEPSSVARAVACMEWLVASLHDFEVNIRLDFNVDVLPISNVVAGENHAPLYSLGSSLIRGPCGWAFVG